MRISKSHPKINILSERIIFSDTSIPISSENVHLSSVSNTAMSHKSEWFTGNKVAFSLTWYGIV
jgi:hypothetical protein